MTLMRFRSYRNVAIWSFPWSTIYAKTFLNNEPMVDPNFAFFDPVSAVYYGGQAGYAHTKMIT